MFIVLSVPNDKHFDELVVGGVFENAIELCDYAMSYVQKQWPTGWTSEEATQLALVKVLKEIEELKKRKDI